MTTVQEDVKDILESVNYTWSSPTKPNFKKIQELEGGLGLYALGTARGVIVRRSKVSYLSFGAYGNTVYELPIILYGDSDDDVEGIYLKIKSIVDAYHLTPFTVNSHDYNHMLIISGEDSSNDKAGNPFVFDAIIQIAQLLTATVISG